MSNYSQKRILVTGGAGFLRSHLCDSILTKGHSVICVDNFFTGHFCFVDDLIDGFQLFMNSDDDFHGPVNLGNLIEFTILELAQKVINLTGSNSKIIYKNLPENDPKQYQPDIGLAIEKLGWKPKIELDEDLEHSIKYFKQLLN